MKRLEEFENFYNDGLKLALDFSEKERKIILIQFILCIVLPLTLIPLFVVIYLNTRVEMYLLPALILLLGAPIYIYSLFGETIFYKNFKKKIIGRIIKYINPKLSYDNLTKIDDYEYFNASFFGNENVINYHDDHVAGIVNGVKVEFAEIVSKYRDKNDIKKNKSSEQFQGLFFVAEFEKPFATDIILKTSGLPFNNEYEDVEIGNEAFDSLFYVKVLENKALIPSVLKPNIVMALLNVRDNCPNEFMVAFKGHNLYLAICHDYDLFEPSIFKTIKNYPLTKEYFEQLFFPLLLVEEVTKEFGGK